MPWSIAQTDRCPASRPYGVIKDDDGELEGCHETEADARRQQEALYASESSSDGVEHKTFEVETKTDEGDAPGQFSALASVFGNVDRVGDRMLPGSFKATLEKWRKSGNPIPVILSHDWDDPHKYVGKADPRAVMETDDGLLVQGQIDTSDAVGAKVYKLMKDRVLTGWSFGYTVPEGGQKQKNGVNEISEVDLFEVGPTLVGANPAAQLQEIKAVLTETKAPKPDELRRRSEKAERELIAEHLPPSLPDEEAEAYKALLDEIRSADPEKLELVKRALAGELVEPQPEPDPDEERNEEPEAVKSPPDSLRRRSMAVVLDINSAGVSRRKPSRPKAEPKPEPRTEQELRRQSRELALQILTNQE